MLRFIKKYPEAGGAISLVTVFLLSVALTIALGLMVMRQAAEGDNHGGSMGAAMIWTFGIPASVVVSIVAGVIVTIVLKSRRHN